MERYEFVVTQGFRFLISGALWLSPLHSRSSHDRRADWHYQSPKHKFQMYCFHPACSLLVEVYLRGKVPPYGAHRTTIPFPKDLCQPFPDFDVDIVETEKRERVRMTEGETLERFGQSR
jgi:DNA sulfur modification protein DndC